MNTMQLECFMAVAEYLNFSRAAETVKLTQPAVSHQISSLEEELNTKLFIRTSKNVKLTPAGAKFINDAINILKIVHNARTKLCDQNAQELLSLNIGCHNQMELSLLPSALKCLIKEYPSLHPSIKLLPFLSMANLLKEESIQIMFGYKEPQQEKPIAHYQELLKCPIVCICSENHPFASHSVLSEKDLKGNIILCRPHRMPPAIFHLQNKISSSCKLSEIYTADEYESIITLVKSDIGFSFLPDLPFARLSGLKYIPLETPYLLSFGVYYNTLKGNPILKRFIQILKEKISSQIEH